MEGLKLCKECPAKPVARGYCKRHYNTHYYKKLRKASRKVYGK